MRLRYAAPRTDHDALIGGINTTPLIDVLLVLLVMFIITIPVMNHKLPIDLPEPGPVPAAQQIPHLLSIERGGAVTLDGIAADRPALAAKLTALRDDPRAELQIKTDPAARYDDFVQTLAVVKRAGITRLGFVGEGRGGE